jgi:alkylation response protein AidB-like acyl-CoA dehydrogenase
MDFDYSEEQQQLRQGACRFLEDRCPPSAVRAVLENPGLSFDRGLWTGLAELGWLRTVIPEVHGGLALGYVELCAIAEELERAVAPVPFASTLYFFAEALLLAGSPAQQAQWLRHASRQAMPWLCRQGEYSDSRRRRIYLGGRPPSVFPACPAIEPGCRRARGLGGAIGGDALDKV